MLVAVGALFCGLMWRSYERARGMLGWPAVEARVLVSEVAERRIGESAEYGFRVMYGYEWAGERLTSERWTLRGSPWSGRPEAARELVRAYPAGSLTRCRVNPAEPAVAVLRVDSRAPGYSLWFPALFVVGGVGIVVGALRRRPGGGATLR